MIHNSGSVTRGLPGLCEGEQVQAPNPLGAFPRKKITSALEKLWMGCFPPYMTVLPIKEAAEDWKTNVHIKTLFSSSSFSHSSKKCIKNRQLGSFSSLKTKHTVCLCHMLSLHCPVLLDKPRNQGK